MFIKNIIISGFRSYREQSFPDGLSPKTNIIVGKNGSGKSNFFAAIQFVLNEKYATLRAADRKELFHVGSGRPSLSIFVEIVFDNTDGRLVIPGRAEAAEVRIRRTVGLKQDEFRVNDTKFSATEVHQLLESAGFSSANPYYVVEQGKIARLASMSEEDRYKLIKDVAGTQVYEDRRRESERILGETEGKQKQIDEAITQLEKRLKELESETTELRAFQQDEQEKKGIEYAIFNAELEQAKDSLAKLEAQWNTHIASLNKGQSNDSAAEHSVQQCMQQLTEIDSRLALLEAEKKTIERDFSALTNQQAVTELDATHAAGRLTRDEKELTSLTKEQRDLEVALQKARDGAHTKKALLETRQTAAAANLADVETQQKQLEHLQEKRNRTKLFATKAERDRWIRDEIATNRELLASTRKEIAIVKQDMADVDSKIASERKVQSSSTRTTSKAEQEMETDEKRISALLQNRDTLNQQRRQLWQSVHEQESAVQRLEEMAQSNRHHLERVVRHDIRQGLQSLREVLRDLNDSRLTAAVHGPLMDLITVEPGYETAVEVTAGNVLFNVVVDSFDTSAALLEEMNKRHKPGRISFFPLDTCRGVASAIPSSADCSPMLSKLKFQKKFANAVVEVFGRTAVVSTLEAGVKQVEALKCDVVTVDGDQLGRRGGITGGFVDKRNMKLPAVAREKETKAKLAAAKKELDALCQQVATVEQSITETLNELEGLRNQSRSNEKAADALLRENRQHEERLNRLRNQKEALLSTVKAHEKSVTDTEALVARLQAEQQEDFKASWSPEEEDTLEKLSETLTSKKVRTAALQAEALQIGTEAQLLEDTVQHLERRITIIGDRVRELGWAKKSTLGFNQENEKNKVEQAALSQRLAKIELAAEKEHKGKQAVEAQLAALRANHISETMTLQQRKDEVDRIQAQRNLLMQRRDDAGQKLRKLGMAPADIQQLAGMSFGKLMHQLKLVNERMRKFAHVNRKALDQHAALLETRNDLTAQRATLEQELRSIHELMEHLDTQKDEAISRTYKQIQFQFEVVFRELVATEDASAELQLVTRDDPQNDDPYAGARIRVSFGLGSVASDLEQLSGGQKSLVALALIFAIQRCDPAPFYLFDEIDAALDAEYRTAVARMVQRQSTDCQFLIASFKTEMLSVADKILGIFFQNKVSYIQTISADEGAKLLRQQAEESRKRARTDEESQA